MHDFDTLTVAFSSGARYDGPVNEKDNNAASKEPRKRWSWKKRLFSFFLGSVVAVLLLEGLLRWHDPLSLRVKGSKVSLPINERLVIENHSIDKADREIVHTRNSIGFRGANPPRDFDRHLTIITVGGSTTECFYLSDDKTWPEQMRRRWDESFENVWVNNAGLDGHSTFGHELLLSSYLKPLRPKVVIYLVGLNDVGNESINYYDYKLRRRPTKSFFGEFYLELTESSAIVNYIENLRRHYRAKEMGVTHGNVNHEQLVLLSQTQPQFADAKRQSLVEQHRAQFLAGYKQRIRQLVQGTREAGIRPVLVTQPALYGDAVDDQTGVDLGKIAVADVNGSTKWQILELYNDATRKVAAEENVPVIDLAAQLSKSSRFFYDFHHFSNEGARSVGHIVADGLRPYLKADFERYARNE